MRYYIKKYLIEEGVIQHVKENLGKYALVGAGLAAAGAGELGDSAEGLTSSAGNAVSTGAEKLSSIGKNTLDHYSGATETATATAPATETATAPATATATAPAPVHKGEYFDKQFNPETGEVVSNLTDKGQGFANGAMLAGAGLTGAAALSLGIKSAPGMKRNVRAGFIKAARRMK